MDMPITGLRAWSVMVSDDGDNAYVPVQEGGTIHIYKVALQGDEQFEAITEGERAIIPLDMNGDTILYTQIAMAHMAMLFTLIFKCWRVQAMAYCSSITVRQLVMVIASRQRLKAIGATSITMI